MNMCLWFSVKSCTSLENGAQNLPIVEMKLTSWKQWAAL